MTTTNEAKNNEFQDRMESAMEKAITDAIVKFGRPIVETDLIVLKWVYLQGAKDQLSDLGRGA